MEIYLEKNNYKDFIAYAFRKCDSFSFVTSLDDYYAQIQKEKILDLDRNKIREYHLGYHPESGTYFSDSRIEYYRCNEETLAVLISFNDIKEWDGSTLPEELCFYYNGKKKFVYITHENFLFLYEPSPDDIDFVVNKKILFHYL